MPRRFCFLLILFCWNVGISAESPMIWDFTTAAPEQGVLRKGAKIENGLVPAALDINVPVGFEIRPEGGFQLPEAFVFEAEFSIQADDTHRSNVLWDNMYVTYIADPESKYHRGFQVAVNDCGGGRWQPALYLGFTRTTQCILGPVLAVEPGKNVKLSFFYDANRSVFWKFGSETAESEVFQPGTIAPSGYRPVIGDRFGSNYCAFNGTIRRVSLTPCKRRPVGVTIQGGSAFERGTKDAKIQIRVENFSDRLVW